MRKNYYVYVYYRPDDGRPFYIGKGHGKRYLQHLTDKPEYCHNKRLTGTIRNYLSEGSKPHIEIYANELTEDEALALEIELIKKYGRKGIDPDGILMNISEGGEKTGPAKGSIGRPHTEESKRKSSETKKKKFASGETVAWNKGMQMSEEFGKRIRETRTEKSRIAASQNAKKAHSARIGAGQSDHQKNVVRLMRQKSYVLTDPTGKEYNITNMSKFCRENDLPNGVTNLFSVASGKLKSYKGWKARYA